MKNLYTVCMCLFAALLQLQAQEDFTNRDVFIAQADERLAPFYHGVASGDPLADRVIIWSRVTPESNQPVTVDWEMSKSLDFGVLVRRGSFTTGPDRDYTIKVDVDGLEANTTYYYRFNYQGKSSVIGRTRTAPAGETPFVRLAVVSCADYQNGYFNAFRHLAERKDINAVLHLGDYLYEYAPSGGERSHVPEGETVSLAQYRGRHSHYKLDPDLRAAHQQNPWIMVWDDHESTNNSHREGAENHTEGAEGNWEERKRIALQAYYEWQPIRVPDMQNDFTRIWRKIPFGNMADIVMMDTRLYDRDEQVASAVVPGADLNDPDRKMIGPDQLNFVNESVNNSAAVWKILGQQVMMTQLNVLGLPMVEEIPVLGDVLTEVVKDGGLAINADAWDGYPQERKRVLENLANNNVNNGIVLTGDIHTSWAADLHWDISNPLNYNPITGGSVAVEFVTPSITSGNGDAVDPTGGELGQIIHPAIRALNPHIKYVDFFAHGYMILDLDTNRAQCDWFYVDNIDSPESNESFGAAYVTERDANFVQQANEPVDRGDEGSPLAPTFGRVTSIANQKAAVILGVYPNPAKTQLNVNLVYNANTQLSWEIVTVAGVTVKSWESTVKPGFAEAAVDLAGLESGMYILRITGSETASSYTFQKQ